VALNECMTYSIGFRAPETRTLGLDLVQRMVDEMQEDLDDERAAQAGHATRGNPKTLYRDPHQAAVASPGEIPAELQAFAAQAVAKALQQAHDLPRLLGESLTEPKPKAWFEAQSVPAVLRTVTLDPCTRMMFDAQHVYINGESYRAAGRDAALMRKLANERVLREADLTKASEGAHSLLFDWCDAGWAHGRDEA
jgi:50S ribosomal protein L16 3-hydroxylase